MKVIDMSKRIRVQVLLFAILAEAAPSREIQLELHEESTVRQAVDQLIQMYPQLQNAPMQHVFFAVNHEYATEATILRDGDELALIPPVSGGSRDAAGTTTASSDDGRFALTDAPLDPDQLSGLVSGPQMGALCTFTGTVRAVTGDRHTTHLFYEAYPHMVIAEMKRIEADLHRQWPDVKVAMHHRIGKLLPGEAAVVIVAAAPHRDSAFPACRFAIDEVKRRCPIWKKEFYANDTTEWVAPDVDPLKAVNPQ